MIPVSLKKAIGAKEPEKNLTQRHRERREEEKRYVHVRID
jgi:hypothetical protein